MTEAVRLLPAPAQMQEWHHKGTGILINSAPEPELSFSWHLLFAWMVCFASQPCFCRSMPCKPCECICSSLSSPSSAFRVWCCAKHKAAPFQNWIPSSSVLIQNHITCTAPREAQLELNSVEHLFHTLYGPRLKGAVSSNLVYSHVLVAPRRRAERTPCLQLRGGSRVSHAQSLQPTPMPVRIGLKGNCRRTRRPGPIGLKPSAQSCCNRSAGRGSRVRRVPGSNGQDLP